MDVSTSWLSFALGQTGQVVLMTPTVVAEMTVSLSLSPVRVYSGVT